MTGLRRVLALIAAGALGVVLGWLGETGWADDEDDQP